MRRILQNCKAYSFIFKILLILFVMNGSKQMDEHCSCSCPTCSDSAESNSPGSSDSESGSLCSYCAGNAPLDMSRIIPDGDSPCGYAGFASYSLTETARMMQYAKKVELEIAKARSIGVNYASSWFDPSKICFPCDLNAKPSDDPEMHCYKLGNQGTWSKKNLTYAIRQYSSKLCVHQVDDAIARSFKAWQDVSPLTFRRNDAKADINVSFVTQLPGQLLGLTAFPMWGGAVHLNDQVNWTVDSWQGANLRQVATHEIGHALGLDHSHVLTATMFPTLRPDCPPDSKLDPDDIAGIQALYGKPPQSRNNSKKSRRSRRSRRSRGSRNGWNHRFRDETGNQKPNIPEERSWHETPMGYVYWPPVKQGDLDVTWLWNQGKGTPYYFNGQGWFPYQ